MSANDVGEIMTAEEIHARFDSEWVLVGDPETEENLVVKRGRVLWHGKDKNELYRVLGQLRPKSSAVLYTGTISEEEALALKLHLMKLSLHDAPA